MSGTIVPVIGEVSGVVQHPDGAVDVSVAEGEGHRAIRIGQEHTLDASGALGNVTVLSRAVMRDVTGMVVCVGDVLVTQDGRSASNSFAGPEQATPALAVVIQGLWDDTAWVEHGLPVRHGVRMVGYELGAGKSSLWTPVVLGDRCVNMMRATGVPGTGGRAGQDTNAGAMVFRPRKYDSLVGVVRVRDNDSHCYVRVVYDTGGVPGVAGDCPVDGFWVVG